MTRFIAIASGKGGAGKTTTAINLGCALSSFGKDVVVIDANLATPHVAMNLGSMKLKRTLNDALEGIRNIKDSAYIHPSGLKIIPASSSFEESMDKEKISQLPNKMLDLLGTTEIILLDSPAGINREVSTVLNAADELILVVNPELASISDALKTIRLAEQNDCRVLGVVVNKISGDKSELDTKNIEILLEKPILAMIPEDINVKRAIALKQPVVHYDPDSISSVNFKKLAAVLMGQHYEETKTKKEVSLRSYLLKQLGLKKEDA